VKNADQTPLKNRFKEFKKRRESNSLKARLIFPPQEEVAASQCAP